MREFKAEVFTQGSRLSGYEALLSQRQPGQPRDRLCGNWRTKGLGGVEARYDSLLSRKNSYVMRSTTAAGTDMLYSSCGDYVDAEGRLEP